MDMHIKPHRDRYIYIYRYICHYNTDRNTLISTYANIQVNGWVLHYNESNYVDFK